MSLTLAVRHALKNPIQKISRQSMPRFGAVLSNGRRYFYGHNSYRTDPFQRRFSIQSGFPEKIHTHSEVSAIKQAVSQISVDELTDYTLYVARVLKDGTPAMACPCLSCWAAIHEFGIKEVYWTE